MGRTGGGSVGSGTWWWEFGNCLLLFIQCHGALSSSLDVVHKFCESIARCLLLVYIISGLGFI